MVGSGTERATCTFIVEGTAPKIVLVRAIGPSLPGVAGFLADPTLTVFDGTGTLVASNDNWGGNAALKTAAAAVGASALTNDASRDAAVLISVNPGIHTVQVSGVGNTTGVAQVEVFDTDATPRIAYFGTQGTVGAGSSGALNVGFTITGPAQTVLIRAVGSSLGAFGFPGVLANPTLTLLSGSTVVGSNDNWGGTVPISNAAANAGLWSLPNGSTDSALLLPLPAGTYTASVSGAGNSTGIVLLEIAQIDNDRAAAFVPMFNEPPTLRTPAAFASQSVALRANVSFRIPNFLAKPLPVNFQWRKNGTNIAGATSAGLTLNNVQLTDAGNYSVALTNSAGTTVSAGATLLVNNPSPPTQAKLGNLSTLTFVNGGDIMTANFMIEGAGAKPVLIRVAGPALAPLGITGVLNDPILRIHDGTGAKIHENDDWAAAPALKAAFSAVGAFPYADNGRDSALLVTLNPGVYSATVVGASASSGNALLEIYDTDTVGAGSRIPYLATRGQLGSTTTAGFVVGGLGNSSASLLVRALGPALASAGIPRALADPALSVFSGATQLASNDNWSGASTLVDAAATAGLAPLASGSADSALLLNAVGGAYTARVSGATASVGMVEIAQVDSSRIASFAPALLVPPSSVMVKLGDSTTLSALAIGKPTPTFQWRKNGTNIPGATASTLTLNNFQVADAASYSIALTNSVGTTLSVSYPVALNPISAPNITAQPVAQGVAAGSTATFSVTALGNPAPGFQWLRDGVALSGATNATLSIANVAPANTGTYTVRVTNSEGSVTSAGAALTIVTPPVIITHPTPQKVATGNPATLKVVATIPAPQTYQWRKDGADIPGATSPTHTIPAAQPANSGAYTVVVTNSAGSTTSQVATLTVTLSYAGTYFGTFGGNLGEWALVVRNDGTGTFVGHLDNPKGGIVAKVTVAADGTFRTPSTLLQLASGVQSLDGHTVAAAATSFTLTGAIGTTTVTGSLEGLGVPLTGTLDPPEGETAALSGLYVASSGTTTTYTVVGSSKQVVALTIGVTLVDGGLGVVATNGTFTVNTSSNTVVTGTVTPSSGTVTSTGTITASVSPASGPTVTMIGAATAGLGPPTITIAPEPLTVAMGFPATFTVSVSGKTPLTYQWKKNGTDLAGATGETYAIAVAQLDDAGLYTCRIVNEDGNATTSAAGLTVIAPSATFPTARLVNLSIRTEVRTPGESFMLGYVIGGRGTAGPKSLVIRAAGPSLAALGVRGALEDPKLELFAGATKIDENDNWGGTPELRAAFASVGAFDFMASTSKDAATMTRVTTRDNVVKVSSAAGNGTGEVIAELYDAGWADPITPRLVNVSVLKHLGAGLTAGFVVGGTGSTTVLIRAVGPTLAADFNIAGAVADPQLSLLSGQTEITSNDNWGGTAELSAAFKSVGAFALPADSRDAALLATLQPGAYTVQVSGVANTSGTAIIEVYEVP
jgi:hypothetical protein